MTTTAEMEKDLAAIAADAPFKDPDGISARILTVSAGIGAYVEAEVARRLAVAPGVEEAIVHHDDAVSSFHDDIDSTRKAILRALGVEEP